MKNFLRLFTLCGAVALMAGCTSYSELVNSFAPEKREEAKDGGAGVYKLPGEFPCCPKPAPISEIYMVMPEEGGKTGTVDVIFKDGKGLQLHGDYSAASVAGDDRKTFISNNEQMKNIFGETLTALPKAPMVATLYFVFGKDELTRRSKSDAKKIYNDFLLRQAPEVLIVGHTDTVGSEAGNDKLSVRRAQKVRQALVQLGIPDENIQQSGRGEREMLIETTDNVKEARNRRVEIHVR